MGFSAGYFFFRMFLRRDKKSGGRIVIYRICLNAVKCLKRIAPEKCADVRKASAAGCISSRLH